MPFLGERTWSSVLGQLAEMEMLLCSIHPCEESDRLPIKNPTW